MSHVISLRIQRELKKLMDKTGLDWKEEIRQFIERRAREELRRRFLNDARNLRKRIGVESSISSAELIREDRELEH